MVCKVIKEGEGRQAKFEKILGHLLQWIAGALEVAELEDVQVKALVDLKQSLNTGQ